MPVGEMSRIRLGGGFRLPAVRGSN
jgi:hypothetical protein